MFGLPLIGHAYRVARSALRERAKNKTRSARWPKIRALHLAVNPTCAACGTTKRPQVHHVEPFHLKPELELDAANLLTLCMGRLECHERLGHGDNFKAYNPAIRQHSALLLATPKDKSLRQRTEAAAKAGRLYSDPLK